MPDVKAEWVLPSSLCGTSFACLLCDRSIDPPPFEQCAEKHVLGTKSTSHELHVCGTFSSCLLHHRSINPIPGGPPRKGSLRGWHIVMYHVSCHGLAQ